MKGLNVGSGQRRFTSVPACEWINLDSVSRPGMEPDVIGTALDLQFADGTFDYVVFHHVLEHLWRADAPRALREAHRVLVPGGSCIVIVPDIAALARRWLVGEVEDEEIFTHMMGAYMGNVDDLHKWHHTPRSLMALLREAGFTKVGRYDWRAIPGADIAAKDFWFHGVEGGK